MDTVIRWVWRHPPRVGWGLFGLGFATVLLLPTVSGSTELRLDGGPIFNAVCAGFVLAFMLGPRFRILWLIPALVVPFGLFDLVPPWRIVEADLRALFFAWRTTAIFSIPPAIEAAWQSTGATLVQAWDGNVGALNWTLARIIALLGYVSAMILALGLRLGKPPLVWCLPLLATVVVTAMTAGARTIYVLFAIMVILLLCIVGAFRTRQRTWERANYSFSDSLQWDVGMFGVALLVVVVLFGALTPPVPYNPITTWLWTDVRLPAGLARLDKSEAAQDGRGSGGGTARVGSTRPGEDLELGRSLELGDSEDVSFTIRAPDIDPETLPYWRGRIFNRYNGRGWETGTITTRAIAPLLEPDEALEFIIQEVNDQRPERQVLHGVPNIVAVNATSTLESTAGGETVGWMGDGAGATYTVYSRPPAPPPSSAIDLIEIQESLAVYRVVPPNLPRRVVDLAEQITAEGRNQTERALAIETYLRGLRYSYEVAPLPLNGDAVDQFLFTMGQGYCTYYASAMAMMARTVGIPSRVVVGYATGEYDAATSTWTVREAEAHAWPELYIEGEGWTRWEPTPVRPVPARVTTPALPELDPVVEQPATQTQTFNWGLVVISLLLLVGFVAAIWFSRRTPPLNPSRVLAELYRYGRRAGIPPRTGDSILEYTDRVGQTVPVVKMPVERVGRLLTARTYRQTPLSTEEETTLLRSWENARDMLPANDQRPTTDHQRPTTDDQRPMTNKGTQSAERRTGNK
jgi:transglutaminase-like putative cysteine protease